MLTIAISVWVALKMLALMTVWTGVHLVNITKIFAVVILYGAGTDYCLFLISRYREELADGFDTVEALARSVSGVGEAAHGQCRAPVMVGLGLMGLAEFAKVRYAGPAIALSLGVALAAALTLTPALLRLLGRCFVFWPTGSAGKPSPTRLHSTRLRLAAKDRDAITGCGNASAAAWPGIRSRFGCCSAAASRSRWCISGLHVKPSYRATGETVRPPAKVCKDWPPFSAISPPAKSDR